MYDGVNRVVEIVRSLKTFVRDDEAEIKEIDFNANLDRILLLFNRRLEATATREAITLERHYNDLPHITCRPAQLNQVFFNLLTNAIEAIDRHANNSNNMRPGCIQLRTSTSGDRIHLEVSDNGIGVPPEQASHIFDPFFTTKDVGHGPGLGLTSCYAIVTEQHGGAIAYRPQASGGSTFQIDLPIAQPDWTL